MTILLVGGSGQIGSKIAAQLAGRCADIRVLSRFDLKDSVHPGVKIVTGDVLDVDFMRRLLSTVDTVFLLNPTVPDELVRSLTMISLVKEAGIRRLVYLSMIGANSYVTSARAVAKGATEAAIASQDLPATILRVNALFQNDLAQRQSIIEQLNYPTPLGQIGVELVDLTDVAEIAALELLRRENSAESLPSAILDVVGPQAFNGHQMAKLWSGILKKHVTYRGDDLLAVDAALRDVMSTSAAYDLVHVFHNILDKGALGRPGAAAQLAELLGRPLRTYRDFAHQMLADHQ